MMLKSLFKLTSKAFQVQEANSELYKKQKAAEGSLYEKAKAAESQRLVAEAQLYARQLEADGDLYAKKKEADGLIALAKAQGIYIQTLLAAVGGDYNALRDYLMIDGGLFKQIAEINADAIKGLKPKISVWTNGGQAAEGAGSGTGAAMKEVASVYRALPPLLETVHEQTGMAPPPWLGSLAKSPSQ